MRALGIDLGDARIGLAVCDSGGLLATPYETLNRVGDRPVEHQMIADRVAEVAAEIVIVGVPYSLDGSIGHKAKLILREIKRLGRVLEVPIETIDERFTTVTAERSLLAAGTKGKKKRGVVDQLAAAVILQSWLDARVES